MANNETTNDQLDPLVTMPHGREQHIKMEIVDMIHRGESPYDIISHVAKWLEEASGERGYAQYVEEQIHAIYGFALEHEKPMRDELHTVEERLKRIERAFENPDFTEEEHIRIGFAIDRHKKNIERLKEMIQRAEADGQEAMITKN